MLIELRLLNRSRPSGIEKNLFLGVSGRPLSSLSLAWMNMSQAQALGCLTPRRGGGTASMNGKIISMTLAEQIKGTHNNLMCYSLIDEEKRKVNHVPLSMVSSYAIK